MLRFWDIFHNPVKVELCRFGPKRKSGYMLRASRALLLLKIQASACLRARPGS
jgi:hypothetical protein